MLRLAAQPSSLHGRSQGRCASSQRPHRAPIMRDCVFAGMIERGPAWSRRSLYEDWGWEDFSRQLLGRELG